MARLGNDSNTRTRGNYHHGFSAGFVGNTPEAAERAAKNALQGNPNKASRKIGKPVQLANDQWSVIVR
jgi:hypothetical protein